MTDETYLNFIRSLPCIICGNPAAESHHQKIRYQGSVALKASDYRAVPLCHAHHVGGGTEAQPGSFHAMSWPFYERYNIDIEQVIAQLVTTYFFA